MNLLGLIRHPHAFFEELKQLPPVPWRFAWLSVLAGLVGGISGALLSRAILDSQVTMMSATYGVLVPAWALWLLSVLLSGAVSFVTWLVLWGMGQLGAGREGRSAEVYAASFLVPLLWSVALTLLAVLLPPHVTVAAPDLTGLKGPSLLRAVQTYTALLTAQYAQAPVVKLSGVMNYAIYLVQFWLAYIGFQVLTADRARAWRGVLYPGGLLVVLGLAALLVVGAAASLTGLLG